MGNDGISIIVVTYNSLTCLHSFLDSLRRNTEGVDYELIVVDNHSRDDSPQFVSRLFPAARVVVMPRNVGFARACNAGAEVAAGRYLVFVNPDVRLDPKAVVGLIEVLRDRPDAGIVGARLRFPDGGFQPTCREFPTLRNLVYSRGSALARWFSRNTRYTLPDYPVVTAVPAVAATFMAIDRSLFFGVGRFDDRFFMFMEDTDLCRRVSHRGKLNLFVPNAGGEHDWGKGSKTGRMKRAWYHHVSVWRYFRKHSVRLTTLLPLAFLLVTNLVVVLLTLPFRRDGRAVKLPSSDRLDIGRQPLSGER